MSWDHCQHFGKVNDTRGTDEYTSDFTSRQRRDEGSSGDRPSLIATGLQRRAHYASSDDKNGLAFGALEKPIRSVCDWPQRKLDNLYTPIVQCQQTRINIVTGNANAYGLAGCTEFLECP
jgi:hypothetical protein